MAGRPTAYKSEYAKIAAKMCEMGATDQDLADAFEVTTRTIDRWKVKHEEFCQALKTDKAGYDDKVERALALRAVGYSHPDTDIRVIDGQIVQTEIIKHYPPDTKAALAWLYNRRRDRWSPDPDGRDGLGNMADVLNNLIAKLPQ